MVPAAIEPLFWDANLAEFDPTAHPDYTIFRVLEYGDPEAYEWLRAVFADADIRRVIRTERRLTPRSANFWALVFGIPHDQVIALRQSQEPVTVSHER